MTQCLTTLKDKGMHVERLTMDGDSTSFNRARRSLFPELEKCGDKNHTIKNFGKSLFAKKGMHKELTAESIAHVERLISYCVEVNRGNQEGLRDTLLAITPHMFGDHSRCQSSWCRSVDNPGRKQAYLFTEEALEQDLSKFMQR